MSSLIELEVCAASPISAQRAEAAGATRVELCTALPQGGTTPSYGAIKQTRAAISIALHVLIRPRGGDFVYNHRELQEMKEDILLAKQMGADGVVFGCLTPQGDYDREANEMLAEAAQGLSITFHRACDHAADFRELFTVLRDSGHYHRILTSGGAPSALEGAENIAWCVAHSQDRIGVMCGAGITAQNIAQLREKTGATMFHGTFKQTTASVFIPHNHVMKQPELVQIDPYHYMESNQKEIARALQVLHAQQNKA